MSNFEDLQDGVVLAELGGHGDGPYCAKYGAGAALVLLGTYIVDDGDSVPYPAHFVFKPGRENYASYLKEHVAAARHGGAKVGVSVISVGLEDTIDFLQAAEEAGADYASLCVYSVMDMFVDKGLGVALCLPENRGHLAEWATAIVEAVNIPVVFKMGFTSLVETAPTIEAIAASGVPIIHMSIGTCRAGSKGMGALAKLASLCGFLIAGGGVKNTDDARCILDAGAEAVAIASAAMKDAALCGCIQARLRLD